MAIVKDIKTRILTTYQWINDHTAGIPEIIHDAATQFNKVYGTEAAAGISYYAIFSIVPLLLVLVYIASLLLTNVSEEDIVLQFITSITPLPPHLIQKYIHQMIQAGGIGGLVGLIGLVYAASGVLFTLIRNINRAWPEANETNPVKGRLLAIALIAILALLMILWAVTITFISLLPNLIIQLFPWVNEFLDLESIHWVFTSKMIPLISAFLAFFVLYRWIPSTKVRWSEAFWGAFIATIAWRIVSAGFAWFLSAGIINYKLIYGSLSTGLALLTWIYLSAFITVFGSHMSAAIARARRASSPTDIP